MKKYLILDIGNSMVDAYYRVGAEEYFFAIENKKDCCSDLFGYIQKVDPKFKEDLEVYLASVNRPTERNIVDAFNKIGVTARTLNTLIMNKYIEKNGFTVSNTAILGADLFADVVGSENDYKDGELIADFGTATKILFVDANKKFVGGVIFPGVYNCANILNDKTDLLELTSMKMPDDYFSLETDEAINSAALYGTAFMVKGYFDKLREESKYKNSPVYITGGAGSIMAKAFEKIGFKEYTYDRFRIMRGIINAFELKDILSGGMIYAQK